MGKVKVDPTMIDESATFVPIQRTKNMGTQRDGTRSYKAKKVSRNRRQQRMIKQYA